MAIKRLDDMIKTRQLGDVCRNDMLSFLRQEGYKDAGGKGGHIKLLKEEGGHMNMLVLPGNNVLRKDQVRYILKQGHYL